MVVHRVVLFRAEDPSALGPLLEKYRTLKQDAKKDGKNYILSVRAGRATEDQRNQGYAFMGQTSFASIEDMKYYDNECEAHQKLKATARTIVTLPALMVFMEDGVGDA